MTPLWTAAEAASVTGGTTAAGWAATGVSIDTRTLEPGDLFVALADARDGHDFVPAALEKGAAAALVSRVPDGVDRARLLVVPGTLEALVALGRARRAAVTARIAGVTGSVGKTSTKEALRTLLAAQGETHASAASYNNHWGVPLTLARMPQGARYGIFEIGMNHAGEITPLTAMVRPHVAIVTTVEAVHLENFPSVAAIADAKAEMFSGLEPGGTAVVYADNPHAQRLIGHAERRGGVAVATFGTAEGADARLLELDLGPSHSDLTAAIRGRTVRVRIGAPGRHWAMNALGILLVVEALGADVDAAIAGFAHVQAPKGRGSRTDVAVEGGAVHLIDESYNANPASMRAAFALLAQTRPGPGGRRIAVLGDMRELGPEAPALHAGLAAPLDEHGADLVFACGPNMAHLFAALPASRRGIWGESSADIAGIVAAELRAGDVVMIKGSNGSRMALVVEAVLERGRGPASGGN